MDRLYALMLLIKCWGFMMIVGLSIYIVTGVIDDSSNISGENECTPFGLTRDMSGGRKQHEEIRLTYIRARFYDPSAGRFITKDSVRDGFNWYSYWGANPWVCGSY